MKVFAYVGHIRRSSTASECGKSSVLICQSDPPSASGLARITPSGGKSIEGYWIPGNVSQIGVILQYFKTEPNIPGFRLQFLSLISLHIYRLTTSKTRESLSQNAG